MSSVFQAYFKFFQGLIRYNSIFSSVISETAFRILWKPLEAFFNFSFVVLFLWNLKQCFQAFFKPFLCLFHVQSIFNSPKYHIRRLQRKIFTSFFKLYISKTSSWIKQKPCLFQAFFMSFFNDYILHFWSRFFFRDHFLIF